MGVEKYLKRRGSGGGNCIAGSLGILRVASMHKGITGGIKWVTGRQ